MGIETRRAAIAAVTWLTCAASLGAQTAEQKTPAHEHTTYDLAVASREQCDLAAAELTEVTRTLSDAKRSDDAPRLRAAVIASERPLAEVKQHLGSCLDILKMMQRAADDGHAASHDAAPVPPPVTMKAPVAP